MQQTVHRWRVLAASVVIVMCTGIIYLFSVFAGPLQEAHGWTTAQVMLAFAINGALAPVPMILGGILLDRGAARALMIAGAVLFGGGFALTGTASTPVQLCLWYGVVTAFGLGLCYTTAVSNTVKLFPDRQGLAAGLFAPLILVSQLSGIGQSQWYGLSAASAALFVSAFAACNAIGGPFWGAIADRRGAAATVTLMSVVSAASFVSLLSLHSVAGLAIGVVGLGPRVAATASGSYTVPFGTAIAVSLAGLALTTRLRRARTASGHGAQDPDLPAAPEPERLAVVAGDH